MIPQVIFQTSLEKQPEYVIQTIQKKCKGWEYKHYTDNEIIQYLLMNPDPEFPFILNKFHSMNFGAHKADLFRYYFLYKQGGVFMDSDAMIETNIDTIVKDYDFFSVKSNINNTIFQGFIGCVPKNPIIYAALKDVYTIDVDHLTKFYHLLTANMYTIIFNGNHTNYKLYKELPSDDVKAITVDDFENQILIHYWKDKTIPFTLV